MAMLAGRNGKMVEQLADLVVCELVSDDPPVAPRAHRACCSEETQGL
jgi:hypothetical protein